jgi:hypothetical protein
MTTAMQCPSCGGRQDAGLLCADCCAIVETLLAAAPQLIDQLDIAISKQAKVGGAGKGGLARERAPINFGALAVRDALLVELAWFEGWSMDELRRHAQIDTMLRDLGQAVKAAYHAIDRMQDRVYLGKCLNVVSGTECVAELWAAPKAKIMRCKVCTYEHTIADRRQDMLDLSEDMLFTVKEASQLIGSYGYTLITESTIRSYVSKGKLGYHGKVEGSSVIRLGDLMEVIRDGASKTRGRKLRRVS